MAPSTSAAPFRDEDLSSPLATRRERRRNIRLPLRYRDTLPERPAALPPPSALAILSESPEITHSLPEPHEPLDTLPDLHVLHCHTQELRRVLRSPKNLFGLFRQYHATVFPSHDPDEHVFPEEIADLVDEPTPTKPDQDEDTAYAPYLNRSSFSLGEWYWCHGVQKSKESFRELVNIIIDPQFKPGDIQDTKWDSINQKLGGDPDDEAEWVDDPLPGWQRTAVTILVPFSRSTVKPGSQEYTIPNFYYRSIVSTIREKVMNPLAFLHFHLEPYKFYWQPGGMPEPVQVHCELYNSQAFLKAHEELQDSPREPGCELDRVVVGLMFASDETLLTSFNNEKLWPLYMYFGNESKYRRCKPSLHLCNHVAYFQKVSPFFSLFLVWTNL